MRDKFFSKTDSKVIHGLIDIIYLMFRIRLLFVRISRGRAISIAKQISRTLTNMVYCVVLSLFPLVPIFLYVIASKMRQKHPENWKKKSYEKRIASTRCLSLFKFCKTKPHLVILAVSIRLIHNCYCLFFKGKENYLKWHLQQGKGIMACS